MFDEPLQNKRSTVLFPIFDHCQSHAGRRKSSHSNAGTAPNRNDNMLAIQKSSSFSDNFGPALCAWFTRPLHSPGPLISAPLIIQMRRRRLRAHMRRQPIRNRTGRPQLRDRRPPIAALLRVSQGRRPGR